MNKPTTYSEWVYLLQQFKEGINDEETVVLMEQGSFEWSKGVAERITQRLYEAIDYRLQKAAEKFQIDLHNCQGNETDLVNAILNNRKRLAIIKKVTQLTAFPDQVTNALYKVLYDYAESTQTSLEDSARSDRTGKLRMVIKNNPITQFDNIENVFGNKSPLPTIFNSHSTSVSGGNPSIKSKRRVLFT